MAKKLQYFHIDRQLFPTARLSIGVLSAERILIINTVIMDFMIIMNH